MPYIRDQFNVDNKTTSMIWAMMMFFQYSGSLIVNWKCFIPTVWTTSDLVAGRSPVWRWLDFDCFCPISLVLLPRHRHHGWSRFLVRYSSGIRYYFALLQN